jgi:hypothetical protein
MVTDKSDRGVRLTLLALVLLALLLRLPNLNQSLWFDEACMSDQRIGTWEQLLSTIHIDIHPPLYLLFAHAWNGIFGDSELSLRIPSLLAGLGSLPLAFLLARRFVGLDAARGTVALLAVSPVHIWYSIEGRLYAPMLFFALLAIELFMRILDGQLSRRGYWLYATVIAVMLALHYYLAIYVLLFALIALAAPRMNWSARTPRAVVWINGVGLLLIAAWVSGKAALIGFQTSQGYLRPLSPLEVYRFLFEWCWTGNSLPAAIDGESGHPRQLAWLFAQVVGVLLFGLGLLELWRRREQNSTGLLLLANFLCLPVFLFVLPLIGMPNTYIERSLLPSLPFFLMIICLGIASLRPLLRGSAVVIVALLSIANLVAFYQFEDHWTVYKPHQDWRSAALYFAEELDEGAGGRPIYSGMPNCRSLPYYDARIQDARNLEPSVDSAKRGIEGFKDVLGEGLGGLLAGYATSVAEEFETQKAELHRNTRLFILPLGEAIPPSVESEEPGRDGILYLLDNLWHPTGAGRVQALVEGDRFEELDRRDLRGLTIFKVRDLQRP